jgi:protein-tyrosine phosphatase
MEPLRQTAVEILHGCPPGSKVLFFCRMGQKRSAAVLCIMLVHIAGWDLWEAKRYMEKLRRGVKISMYPNKDWRGVEHPAAYYEIKVH